MSDNVYILMGIVFQSFMFLVFFFLYWIEHKKHILLWCLSWLFFTMCMVASFYRWTGNYSFFTYLENIFFILASWALIKGSLLFFQKRTPSWIDLTYLVLCAYALAVYLLKLSDVPTLNIRTAVAGIFLIYTGFISMRAAYVKSAARYLLGSFFILWGSCNLFFLLGYRLGNAIFMLAFSLINIVSIVTTLCLLIVYFLHNRENQTVMDQKLQYLIMHDHLTGVYNRGYCELEIQKTDREEFLPVSIILGDLNGLKLINDTFGHQKGDQLIAETAQIIRTAAPGQIVGRWGGDEFIIVLPKTSYKKALEVMESIKEHCSRYHAADHVPLDISLGAATKIKARESMTDIIDQADNMLYKNKLSESRIIKKSMVDYLKNILLEKNIETEQHVIRMKRLAYMMGSSMNLPDREQEELGLLAYLHDIGKISIPDTILNKPGKLSHGEWEIMKRHTEIGYRILASSDEFVHIAHAVLCHHEYWNGSGYPQGLRGAEIPLLARIIAVIDSYDAMTQTRAYKERLGQEEALAEIKKCAGTQFDPLIAEIFIRLMREYSSKDVRSEEYKSIANHSYFIPSTA